MLDLHLSNDVVIAADLSFIQPTAGGGSHYYLFAYMMDMESLILPL
jgi:hypothetical protein